MNPEQIIANVMGYYPPVSTTRKIYVKNTLRGDKKPGCWFAHRWGELRLFDYGDLRYNKANYFDLVALKHFGTKTEYQPSIIPEVRKIISGMGSLKYEKPVIDQFNFDLQWSEGDLTQDIIDFYGEYGIEASQLRQDRITGVQWYQFNSEETPGLYSRYYPNDLCIAMPRNGHVKFYRPYNKEHKWITDCVRGDWYYWQRKRDRVFITGSHKDGRCLYNMGHSVWAWQSETNFPSAHDIRKFRDCQLIYLGDIDEGGIRNAQENIARFERGGIKVLNAQMPLGLLKHGIKDVAALVKKQPLYAKQVVDKTINRCIELSL